MTADQIWDAAVSAAETLHKRKRDLESGTRVVIEVDADDLPRIHAAGKMLQTLMLIHVCNDANTEYVRKLVRLTIECAGVKL